jgi:hypothetical protein
LNRLRDAERLGEQHEKGAPAAHTGAPLSSKQAQKELTQMRQLKLLGLAALALFAFGAFASSAMAVEPEILCLVAGCEKLEGTLKGGVSSLVDLSGKTIEGKTAEAKLKGCKNDPVSETDVNLCVDVPLTFTGTKKGAVACRSENAKGEKSKNVEEINTLLDLHEASEETSAKVLQPLLTALVLGSALEAELIINCGGVKAKVKGIIACLLLPGGENIPTTKEVTVLCQVAERKEKEFDPITGTCTVLCSDLGTIGLSSSLDGTNFVDSWENIELKGTLNKDVFIDD